jgi:hypothetical protein
MNSENPRPAAVTPKPHTLLIYLDETGSEDIADPGHPVFGIGGCAVMVEQYLSDLYGPWRRMKADCFGGPDVALHASELRNPTPKQLDALSDFFSASGIFRFAAMMKLSTANRTELTNYQLTAYAVRMRVLDAVNRCICKQAIMFFEDSKRTRRLAERYFADFYQLRSTDGSETIQIDKYHMPKTVGDPGLEVADFVMHAAGGQVRERQKGNHRWRRDFQVVFQGARPELKSYIEVDTAA